MHLLIIGALCFYVVALPTAKADVRHISTKKDQITKARTALGIATIIQVPDRPTSVVIGDQNSFKIEYLNKAITIKPLVANASTNLYIYTAPLPRFLNLKPPIKASSTSTSPRKRLRSPWTIAFRILCRSSQAAP